MSTKDNYSEFYYSDRLLTDQPASALDANYNISADFATAVDTSATMEKEHDRLGKDCAGSIDSGSPMETASTCHYQDRRCACGLEELLHASLVDSPDCTDEEAEEILYNYQAEYGDIVEPNVTARTAIGLVDIVLDKKLVIEPTGLTLGRNGSNLQLVPDKDQLCDANCEEDAAETEHAMPSGEHIQDAYIGVQDSFIVALDFVGTLQKASKSLGQDSLALLGDIRATKELLGKSWTGKTCFNPETHQMKICISPQAPGDGKRSKSGDVSDE